jgi:hypothetical protein
MNSPQTLNAYAKETKERKYKHHNQQLPEQSVWSKDYPKQLGKESKWVHPDYEKHEKKVKPKVDLEAILALEEELWNS